MTKETLKAFILENAMTKVGGLNNRACIKSWWDNKNISSIYDEILLETSCFDYHNPTFAERLYSIVNSITSRPVCQGCGENKCNFNGYKDGYWYYCSAICSTKCDVRNAKLSKAAKNNSQATVEKIKKSNLLKYGKENYYETDEFKSKAKSTKMKRYGDPNYCNKEKAIDTCMDRYGVKYTTQSEEVIRKMNRTRANTNPEIWNSEWLEVQNSTKGISQIAEELGVTYRTVYLAFDRLGIERHYFETKPLKMQNEIYEFVSTFGYETLMCDRNMIKPKEIDILVKEKNFGIELNGIYWHSVDENYTQEDKMKHFNKTKLCNEAGIRLIQLWDSEWVNKKEICKDIIRRGLGKTENVHYARDFEIGMVPNDAYNEFLKNNHIQGSTKAKFKYGLYKDGILYCIMSFGQSRFEKDAQELIRFCTLCNHHIIGGSEKLFKFHTRNNKENIVSYCDNRLFVGKMYSSLGFVKVSDGVVDYVWINHKNEKLSRYKTQKHKLHKLLVDNFNSNLTEDQNMFANRYYKLYGCGHSKWEYRGQ